ncbi:MAG: Crp/Fnr family transcriptional regulator [Kiloniellaceae bacterium]
MATPENRKIDFGILPQIGLQPIAFDKDQQVFEQGSAGHEMFLVRKGRLAIVVNGKQIEEVGAGGVFGEMGLIDGSPRSATVVALEPCEVVPVTERNFVYLVHETPFFALDGMRTLAGRIRRMNERVVTP